MFDHRFAMSGETFSFTFTRPGTYHFYCQPHSDFMFGTIQVEADD
jgi:plastocyanin